MNSDETEDVKQQKPDIIFGNTTTTRLPQLSATVDPGLKHKESTPYTTGM